VYAALLAGASRLLFLVTRRNRALGLGAGAVFLALFVHSLFYSGFFEDPIVWGVMALAGWAVIALPPERPLRLRQEPNEHASDGGQLQGTAPQLRHQAPLAD
jgi:hypothetical protein